ncbi:hypothetical protein BH11BAC7_BH11BAC7_13330 [soil metagenome]
MIKRILSMVLISGISAFAFAQKTTTLPEKSALKTPVAFTENKGQVADADGKPRPEIKFTAEVNGVKLFFRQNGVSYVFNKEGAQTKGREFYRTDLEFIHTSDNVKITGEAKQEAVMNYYLPHCPAGITNVSTYTSIVYHDLYPGIDLEYFIKEGGFKYQYIVHSGADASLIQFQFKAIDKITLDVEKGLTAFNPLGEIHDAWPVSFTKENHTEVETNFVKKGNVISFSNAAYDKTQTLVIDPFLRMWGTYFGSSGSDTITAMDYYPSSIYANAGIYVTGTKQGDNNTFPVTVGAFQTTSVNIYGLDVFVSRFNTNGGLMWSTLYSTNSFEYGNCIAANASGVVVGGLMSGTTTGFGTPGTFQPNPPADYYSSFLVKFDANGVRSWGIYFGFPASYYTFGYTNITGIDMDASNNIVICGNTNSTSLSSLPPLDPAWINLQQDPYHRMGFIAKFNSTGNRTWSTTYPHTNLNCVKTLSDGRIAIAGKAEAGTLLHNPSQPAAGGMDDAFVSVILSGGNGISFATYLGGPNQDEAFGVDVDGSNNVYVTGKTSSTANITSPGSYQQFSHGQTEAFLAKYSSLGSKAWSTYYGGDGNDNASCISVTPNGEAFIAGQTTSSSPQLCSPDALKNNFSGYPGVGMDCFVAKFSTLGFLIHSTYYGNGENQPVFNPNIPDATEKINAIVANSSGDVVIAGYTTSAYSDNSFSLATAGVFQPNPSSGMVTYAAAEGFIGFLQDNEIKITSLSPTIICTNHPVTIDYSILHLQYNYYQIYAELSDPFGGFTNPVSIGFASTSVANGTIPCIIPTGTMAGSNYKIRLRMLSPFGIYTILSVPYPLSITIKSTPAAPVITNNAPVCSGLPIYFNTAAVSGATYSWTGPAGFTSNWQNAIVSPTTTANSGTYSLVITQNGCTSEPGTSPATVYALPPKYTLSASGTTKFCSGLGVTLSVPANPFFSYRWYKNNVIIPGATSNSYYVTTSGDYYVLVTSFLSHCSNTSFVTTVTVYGCRAGDPAPDKVVEELVLYPNPSSGEITLQIPYDEMNPISQILIYDATGQLVMDETKSNSGDVKMDLGFLGNGIYFIRVKTGDVFSEKKIIINK